eukprot:s27_g22.t1
MSLTGDGIPTCSSETTELVTSRKRYSIRWLTYPGFKRNYTKHPCGARKNPTKGVVPHDGTTTMLKPPWGVLTGKRDPLNYRAVPPTMKRAFSTPSIARSNDAARTAGSLMASGEGSVSLWALTRAIRMHDQIPVFAKRCKHAVYTGASDAPVTLRCPCLLARPEKLPSLDAVGAADMIKP